MQRGSVKFVFLLVLLAAAAAAWAQDAAPKPAPAPNGIEFVAGYENWRVVSLSQREDNNTLRVILGNDTAIEAARSGKTNPWPDGTILAKVAWKRTALESYGGAFVPGDFLQVEFMLKDSRKYAQTKGWGFARWRGAELTPYGKDADFVQECIGCHTPVAQSDYVFSHPAKFYAPAAK